MLNDKNKTDYTEVFKRYWVFIPVAVLLAWALPLIQRMLQDAKLKSEQNQAENQQKLTETVLSTSKEINNLENKNLSPKLLLSKFETVKKKYPNVTSPAKWNALKTSAQKIAFAFGTNTEASNTVLGVEVHAVGSWFEDEQEAVKELKKHIGTFPILADLYYNLFTLSHSLKIDCYEYLSDDNIDELRKVYGQYNNL